MSLSCDITEGGEQRELGTGTADAWVLPATLLQRAGETPDTSFGFTVFCCLKDEKNQPLRFHPISKATGSKEILRPKLKIGFNKSTY